MGVWWQCGRFRPHFNTLPHFQNHWSKKSSFLVAAFIFCQTNERGRTKIDTHLTGFQQPNPTSKTFMWKLLGHVSCQKSTSFKLLCYTKCLSCLVQTHQDALSHYLLINSYNSNIKCFADSKTRETNQPALRLCALRYYVTMYDMLHEFCYT